MSSEFQVSVEFGVIVLQKIIEATYGSVKVEHRRTDLFKKSTEKYVRSLIERFGEVKILGMDNPVPLINLYVRANILDKITTRTGTQLEELEKFFDFDRRAFGKKKETKDGKSIANQLQRFIVLGKPGAGKTTFLKYLALAMVHEQSVIENRRLPIFITLRDWADGGNCLMEYITGQFKLCGFEQPDAFVDDLLKQGKCLVLFDGLDEVSLESNVDGIIREIRDFTDLYYTNQFIISCRVAAYNHWFERFTDVEIADFDEKQIEVFVRNWFADKPKTANACLDRMKASSQLQELSSVPLLLALLCIAYNQNNDFPANRAELYEDAIDALLRKWDASRRIHRNDPYKLLSIKQKENMFARIAYGAFTENRYFIRERDLVKIIENFINNLPAFKVENLEVDGTEVLRAIEEHHGIFVERAKHIHSFAHLTFQEYFTAKYIVDNDNMQNRVLEALVHDHLYDSKWQEVFMLVSGMLPAADELLLLMLNKNQRMLTEPPFNNLLKEATIAVSRDYNQYSVVLRRTVAMFVIVARARTFARIRGLPHGLSLALDQALDRARNLVHALALTLGLDLPFGLDLDPNTAINRGLSHDFNLVFIPIKKTKLITKPIIEKLSTGLQANVLIISCLNRASYFSKETREHILGQILMPE